MTITPSQLTRAVAELALDDRPVMVHTSLRSFGEPVEGGADAILDALLSRGCTVLVPTFTEPQFEIAAPRAMRPSRNGIDYDDPPDTAEADNGGFYTTDGGAINRSMGALPARLIARGAAHRGEHPLNSFAALGPRAAEFIAPQQPTDVYAPIRVLAEQRGMVLLIGLDLNRMTALHLAEQRSGRRLFVRWARGPDGRPHMVETGSCSEGFPRLAPHLRDLARTTSVGTARWSAYPAAETLDAAVAAITADRTITHCDDAHCLACRDSIAGGPLGPAPLG